jgi:molybdopterin synthase catalytic subunit
MYEIVRDRIDPHALERIARRGDGGIVTFLGVVRDDAPDGRPVRALWYEAHDAMAVAEFGAIASEARERFGDVRMAMVHRIGELGVGEISVAVLAAAAHRSSAFDACRYAIDQLKRRAPIWKKELYADGSGEWKETDAG